MRGGRGKVFIYCMAGREARKAQAVPCGRDWRKRLEIESEASRSRSGHMICEIWSRHMMERSALPPIRYMRNGLRKVSLIGADGEGMQRSE